jgi:hypothetical protein
MQFASVCKINKLYPVLYKTIFTFLLFAAEKKGRKANRRENALR